MGRDFLVGLRQSLLEGVVHVTVGFFEMVSLRSYGLKAFDSDADKQNNCVDEEWVSLSWLQQGFFWTPSGVNAVYITSILVDYLNEWYRFELEWIVRLQSDSTLVPFFRWLTDFALWSVPVTIIAFVYFVNWRRGVLLGVLYSLGVYVNAVAKMAFGMPRPFWLSDTIHAWTTSGSFGMPSGHVLETSVVWFGIAFTYPRKWVLGASAVLTGAMAYSRVYLGVHFILDVAVGIGIALCVAWKASRGGLETWLFRPVTCQRCIQLVLLIAAMVGVAGLSWTWGQGHEIPPSWPMSVQGLPSLAGAYTGIVTFAGLWIGAGMALTAAEPRAATRDWLQVGGFIYAMLACFLLRELPMFLHPAEHSFIWSLWHSAIRWGLASWVVVYATPVLVTKFISQAEQHELGGSRRT